MSCIDIDRNKTYLKTNAYLLKYFLDFAVHHSTNHMANIFLLHGVLNANYSPIPLRVPIVISTPPRLNPIIWR